MQTVLQIACGNGRSLRDVIAGDTRLAEHGLSVVTERKVGRSPGWTKIRSEDGSCPGAINIQWHAESTTLICRVVNRASGRPHSIIGHFIDYLLRRYRNRIKSITIHP
jgi:hypothetical protein